MINGNAQHPNINCAIVLVVRNWLFRTLGPGDEEGHYSEVPYFVSHHRKLDCLFNNFLGLTKTLQLTLLGLREGNPPVSSGFRFNKGGWHGQSFYVMTSSWFKEITRVELVSCDFVFNDYYLRHLLWHYRQMKVKGTHSRQSNLVRIMA